MSGNQNETIYAKYRSTLRGLRKSEGSFGRTAARKQAALKATADQFGVRIGEVKNIVRELDAKNGITHEHPKTYNQYLDFELAFKEAVARLGNAPCEICNLDGSNSLVRPRLLDRLDPQEYHMQDFLRRQEVLGKNHDGKFNADDFHQLCYLCKLERLGYVNPKIAEIRDRELNS